MDLLLSSLTVLVCLAIVAVGCLTAARAVLSRAASTVQATFEAEMKAAADQIGELTGQAAEAATALRSERMRAMALIRHRGSGPITGAEDQTEAEPSSGLHPALAGLIRGLDLDPAKLATGDQAEVQKAVAMAAKLRGSPTGGQATSIVL